MLNDFFKKPDLRELQQQLSFFHQQQDGLTARLLRAESNVYNLQQQQANQPSAPAANALWNGELGHSVNSWHDAAYTTDDKSKECAWFFSHDAAPAALLETDARTSSTNNTLKRSNHSTYDAAYSDWDAVRGQGRITGTKTVDTPLPSNFIEPGNNSYVSFIAARRNRYISIPSTSRLFAGFWDATAAINSYITGSIALAGAVVGAPASTTERRYKIFVETDRGYTILSNEVTLANAPADGHFSSLNYVSLAWRSVVGALKVQVWRYTPSTGVYHLLEEISSGITNYIDLGTTLTTGAGYPSASTSNRQAVFYTLTGEASALAIDGVDAAWSIVNAPISVPDNYDKSLTTGRQWLRIGQTVAANLEIGEITSDGSDTITAPAAGTNYPTAFEAAYASLFVGLTAKIYDSSGALTLTTTVAARVSDTQLQLATTVPTASGQTLVVEGGGFHGIIFDKIHLTFQRNVSFMPNPLDVRTLQPVAAPSSGTQGTVGGGGGGGIFYCLRRGTPVDTLYGSIPVEQWQKGDYVFGENIRPNLTREVRTALAPTRTLVIKTPDGTLELDCTDTERFRVSIWDERGMALRDLREGDAVYVNHDGRDLYMPILSIGALQPPDWVYHPTLDGGHYFRAGTFRPNWKRRILEALGIKKKTTGGAYIHNRKDPNLEL